MIKRIRNQKALIAFLITVFLSISFISSCNNFMSGDDDLKAAIEDEVLIANAEEITITVEASAGGTTSLSGQVNQKVGVPFSLTATPFETYAFNGWTASGDGAVTFSAPKEKTTAANIGNKASNIVLTANFNNRPDVYDNSPIGTDVLRNQAIYVQFTKEMEQSTLNTGTISVTGKPAGVPGAVAESIIDDFTLSTSADGFTLSPTTNMDANFRVTVTISKDVLDIDGYTMAEDFSWNFTTGSTTDTSIPTFVGDVTVEKGQVTTTPAIQILGDVYATNTKDITLNLTGNSNSGSVTVTAIEITEYDISTRR